MGHLQDRLTEYQIMLAYFVNTVQIFSGISRTEYMPYGAANMKTLIMATAITVVQTS